VFPDAARIAAMADATLLVIDRARAREAPVRRMRAALEQVHARMIGIVVNRVHRVTEQTYYYEAYTETGQFPVVRVPATGPVGGLEDLPTGKPVTN
jgi:Mrp family chromosome partitioning ATPase